MILAVAFAATIAGATPGVRVDTAMCKAMRGMEIEMGRVHLAPSDSARLATIRRQFFSGRSLTPDSMRALTAAKDRILGYEPSDTAVQRAIRSILLPPRDHSPRSDSILRATAAAMNACASVRGRPRD
jgi:hypothetical protein